MVILELFNLGASRQMTLPDQIYCVIRKRWIRSTPEEKIRQFILLHMIKNLDYPEPFLIVEKSLDQLSFLTKKSVGTAPLRRFDLLVLAKDLIKNEPFSPLLLMEFKAVPLGDQALRQVLGYNYSIQAPFVAVANQEEIRLAWHDHEKKGQLHMIPALPPYSYLINQAKQILRANTNANK